MEQAAHKKMTALAFKPRNWFSVAMTLIWLDIQVFTLQMIESIKTVLGENGIPKNVELPPNIVSNPSVVLDLESEKFHRTIKDAVW